MPVGLSPFEVGLLRVSVGYGTHKRARPLSPVEVGLLLRRLRDAGHSLADCAKAARLGESTVSRFLRIVDLPHDLQHLVDWGTKRGTVGFSCAVELTRISDADDQRAVVEAILVDGLDSKEVRQVAQLRTRSERPVGECVGEVLGMRPKVEKRYVFIGRVGDSDVGTRLGDLTQAERDDILMLGVEKLDLHVTSGRLGVRFFTLVGDRNFDAAMRIVGKDHMEEQLRGYIGEILRNAEAYG